MWRWGDHRQEVRDERRAHPWPVRRIVGWVIIVPASIMVLVSGVTSSIVDSNGDQVYSEVPGLVWLLILAIGVGIHGGFDEL